MKSSKRYLGILADMDGTMNRGDRLIPGAREVWDLFHRGSAQISSWDLRGDDRVISQRSSAENGRRRRSWRSAAGARPGITAR
jgi:hypothetical protein